MVQRWAWYGVWCCAVFVTFCVASDFALRSMYALSGVYSVFYIVYFVQYDVFCVVWYWGYGLGDVVLGCMVLSGMQGIVWREQCAIY